MFEAIHGSAPKIAARILQIHLVSCRQPSWCSATYRANDIAEKIQNARLKTIEEGIHTPDIFKPEPVKEKVGTKEFAEAVINNLKQK